ncbi:MAG: hypothetical protein AAF799_00350 [Myxococcota bacterium]
MLTSRGEGRDSPRTQIRIPTKALRVEWLGQTVASLCWIGSVLVYGLNGTGDWLQLMAASAWLLANIAALAPAENER